MPEIATVLNWYFPEKQDSRYYTKIPGTMVLIKVDINKLHYDKKITMFYGSLCSLLRMPFYMLSNHLVCTDN